MGVDLLVDLAVVVRVLAFRMHHLLLSEEDGAGWVLVIEWLVQIKTWLDERNEIPNKGEELLSTEPTG